MRCSGNRFIGPRRAAQGFTLVETLVAFAVLVMVVVVALRALSDSLAGGNRSEELRRSVQLAQAKLDAIGVTELVSDGGTEGRFENGFGWRVDVRRVATAAAPSVPWSGAWVEVTVRPPSRWLAKAGVTLTSFKLMPARSAQAR